MRKQLAIFPLLLVLLGLGCEQQLKPEKYTETKIEWQGASAEELKLAISPIASGAELVVIEDGQALLYHGSSANKTEEKLEQHQGELPKSLQLSTPQEKQGSLPEAPAQETRDILELELNAEELAVLGISAKMLADRVRELELGKDKPAAKEVLRGEFIKTPSGEEIPLNTLIEPKLITVKRPLILVN